MRPAPKTFLVAILLLAFCGLLWYSEARADSVSFTTNLSYGIENSDDVQALQEFLTDQGVYTGPISGNFFSLTKVAVKKFQAAHNLPVTGYFGILSRAVANSLLTDDTPVPAEEVGTTTPVVQPPQPQPTQTCVEQYYGTFNGYPMYVPRCTQSQAQPTQPISQSAPQAQTPMTEQATQALPVPQFQNFSATAEDMQDGTKKVTITFKTDINTVATLGLMQQGARNVWANYIAQETKAGTDFTFEMIRPANAVEFYGVQIIANEVENYQYGQTPTI